jgi:hypothetical protein
MKAGSSRDKEIERMRSLFRVTTEAQMEANKRFYLEKKRQAVTKTEEDRKQREKMANDSNYNRIL